MKLRHYEKATKFEKNIPPFLTKQLFSLSSVKTSGRFFQIPEKLDFTRQRGPNSCKVAIEKKTCFHPYKIFLFQINMH